MLYPNNMREPFWYFHKVRLPLRWIHDKINEKQKFAEYQQGDWDDLCYVEVSGMDCDGVQYSGHVMTCNAVYYECEAMIKKEYELADGPIYFRLISKAEAEKIVPYSRDRMMEAFEDGHPNTLYY